MERGILINRIIHLFKELKQAKTLLFEYTISDDATDFSYASKYQESVDAFFLAVEHEIVALPYSEYTLVEIDNWLKQIEIEIKAFNEETVEANENKSLVLNGLHELLVDLKIRLLEHEFDIDGTFTIKESARELRFGYNEFLCLANSLMNSNLLSENKDIKKFSKLVAPVFDSNEEDLLIDLYKLKHGKTTIISDEAILNLEGILKQVLKNLRNP